jgi:hypothetical protein
VWVQLVLLASCLLAAYRLLLLPPGQQRAAEVKAPRFQVFDLPARLTHGQRKRRLAPAGDRASHLGQREGTTDDDLTDESPCPRDTRKGPARAVDPAPRRARRASALLADRTP